ncbi:peptidase M3 [Luteitalea sp. TBR-22]|uniref:M3 family metallopeptidase n=1 Tax=Luteitalea sp. TBR-22 TaxID=2802971 RepID=UPI001AFB688D|nr:M3 family metallopeptidase [Luteitalea sp. TBR-22]BCS33110.1 peptidase M3 [Luteitalea sp. TBR-22]
MPLKPFLPAGLAALGLLTTAVPTPAQPATTAASNPLLQEWTGPYGGVPPWDKVDPALFKPAFLAAIDLQRKEIDAITSNPAPPSFANTIEALQRAGRALGRIDVLFGVMTNNRNAPEYQALDRELSPVFAAADDETTFNEKLFARVAAVQASMATAGLTPEQQRLTQRTYDGFVRQGAKLGAAQKKELSRINQDLASAFSDFATKVLADEDTWTTLDSEADLAGLPPALVSAYKAAAEERKLPGKWAVVNTRSSVDPFLTFSSRRDLREKVWKTFKSRGDNGNANDTNAVIARIVKLRAERAALLGYPTHAHWRMDDTMARDPQKAMDLMLRVWAPAVARVKEEVADMQAVAAKEGQAITIEPWDYLYYAEKVRKAKYALDTNELKPYFELNNVIAASYAMAEKLYGLTFTEITGTVPVFHPDVRVYEVKDKATGRHVGVYYRDDFARQYKRSGAWASGYRGQRTFDGPVTPITSNNNNFVKGAAGEPVLISLDDARTLFHEFGHALHGLLMNVTYPGLAGTPRDFVEFPSQVHENWVLTRDLLDTYFRHYKTRAPMPQALVDKVKNAAKFNQGYATVEYLASAIVDMRLHLLPGGVVDADAFERDTLTAIGAPKEVAMRHRLPQFNHLFTSDSYSAGYYSYLWSDVMASDAWAAFEEAGSPWDPAVAGKFKDIILATGNRIDRAEAYRQFRGREPDVNALLANRGFPTTAPAKR